MADSREQQPIQEVIIIVHVFDMAKGKTKSSIAALEEYLKKNASINSEIAIVLKDGNVHLGTIKKSGNGQFFIPPEVNMKSDYKVDIPSCCKFVLSQGKDELKYVQLEGFDEVVTNLKRHQEEKYKIEKQFEVKQVQLLGTKRKVQRENKVVRNLKYEGIEDKEQKKREAKASEKAIRKFSKEKGRKNRDNVMNLFAAWYNENGSGRTIKNLKIDSQIPQYILNALENEEYKGRMQQFINGQKRK